MQSDPRLIVGRETFDDAGVFVLSDDLALVQTVDFFAPIVDDPYLFGQIAAANALSDVYAMGGEPLTALNIVGFPVGQAAASRCSPRFCAAVRTRCTKPARSSSVATRIIDEELKFGLVGDGPRASAAHSEQRECGGRRSTRAHEAARHRHSSRPR